MARQQEPTGLGGLLVMFIMLVFALLPGILSACTPR